MYLRFIYLIKLAKEKKETHVSIHTRTALHSALCCNFNSWLPCSNYFTLILVFFSLFDALSLIRFDKNLITNTYWPTNTDRHRWYDRELMKHARLTSWKSSLFELKSFINYISWQQKLEEKKNCDAIDSFFSNTWVETLDYVTKTLKLLCFFFSSIEVV